MTTNNAASCRRGKTPTESTSAANQQQTVSPAASTKRASGTHRATGSRLWVMGMLALSYPTAKFADWVLSPLSSDARSLAFSEEFLAKTMPVQFGGLYGTEQEDRESDITRNMHPQRHAQSHKRSTTAVSVSMSATNSSSNAKTACLTTTCMQTQGQALARAFPDRTDQSQWCKDTKAERPNKEGLILVKVPKAASSTSAGVALRIANRHKCQALQWQHKPGTTYAHRDQQNSFLFTSIRDPASRVLSYLFFIEISIDGGEYSDEWILDRLKHFSGRYGSIQDGQGGFTMQFAALEEIPHFSAWSPKDRIRVKNPEDIQERVQRMVQQDYDFMLVVERMDESLVALSLLLGIDVADVLVTSSKVAGSYFYDPPRHQCVSLTKSFASPAVKEYLESDDWKAQNYGDYLLHAAANRSLDLTIERLGRQRFDVAMERYRLLQKREKEQCAPHVQFPCSKSGQPQPKRARQECYQRDFGCGYKCIDEIVAEIETSEARREAV
ncbi:expressed unknown protein [Seminavis robusta]|uniref:Uncharacterized protein n=1 Tax=Seminavis robusta TaxID=568900 RepID=A0A9N8ETW2_9STRA|nr:expressed unknown protein [Seminavis robusta]|eukprot:Sro1677_g290600.1 n/a (498) ;mRNA; r:16532-18025